MAFIMHCSNKFCRKEQEPVLDISSNKVFCSICDEEIQNVTIFTKTQMRSLGQIKRAAKSTGQTFSVKCNQCEKTGQPKIIDNDKIICGLCKKELSNISVPYKRMLMENLKREAKDSKK